MDISKYAKLAVRAGINLQEKEGLIIGTSVHGLELAREAAKEAYECGAKHVEIMFGDDDITLAKYIHGKDFVFEYIPQWKIDSLIAMYEDDYQHLFISSPDPELLSDVPGDLIAKEQKLMSKASAPAMKYRMTARTRWSILAAPSPGWAKKVFPDLPESEAMDLLWEKIAMATRADTEDPISEWQKHDNELKRHVDLLNGYSFDKITLQAPGTDLEVGMANGHEWVGGSKKSLDKISFIANIPTEEVFSTPHKYRVNGTLKATKPLSLNGKIVKDFGFTFKDGKVIDFYAGTGYGTLSKLLDNDEGAKYLGEIALVPDDSPISASGILFNNTLFDENASVHFALGRAYPYAMKNGANRSSEELEDDGANFSLIHTDFMVGGPKMQITGHLKDGQEIRIFENGNWII